LDKPTISPFAPQQRFIFIPDEMDQVISNPVTSNPVNDEEFRYNQVMNANINFDNHYVQKHTDGRKSKLCSDPRCPRRTGQDIWDYVLFRFNPEMESLLSNERKKHLAAIRHYYIKTGKIVTSITALNQERRWIYDTNKGYPVVITQADTV
jgi:hypothetical protein